MRGAQNYYVTKTGVNTQHEDRDTGVENKQYNFFKKSLRR